MTAFLYESALFEVAYMFRVEGLQSDGENNTAESWRRGEIRSSRFSIPSHRISRLKEFFSETIKNIFETKKTILVQKKSFLGIEGFF